MVPFNIMLHNLLRHQLQLNISCNWSCVAFIILFCKALFIMKLPSVTVYLLMAFCDPKLTDVFLSPLWLWGVFSFSWYNLYFRSACFDGSGTNGSIRLFFFFFPFVTALHILHIVRNGNFMQAPWLLLTLANYDI